VGAEVNDLPPGFVLDEPATKQGLPEGFVLDKPKPAKSPSIMDSIANWNSSVANGLTGGFYDELIKAPTQTGVDALFDAFGAPKKPGFGEGYSANLAAAGKEREAAKESMPYTSYGGETIGAIASPLAKVLMPAGRALSLAGRIGQNALGGARIGAVYGAGNTEGTVADRVEGMGGGALTGGAMGGLLQPVIEGATHSGHAIANRFVQKINGVTAADRKIANLVADLGGGDMRVGTQEAAQRLADAGPGATLADVLGMPAQRMARAAANIPGEGSTLADEFIAGRQGSRGSRMQATADALGPRGFHDTLDALNATKRADAAPLYEDAFTPVSDKAGKVFAQWDDRLQEFLDDPLVKQGMAKGIRTQQLEALAAGKKFDPSEYAVKGFDDNGELIIGKTPNLRAMDSAKRGMDEIINDARDPTTGKIVWTERLRAIDKVRSALVKKLDDITRDPVTGASKYADARAVWAGPSKLEDAMWQGRKFLRGDEEISRKTFDSLSPGEQDAFKMGVRREIGGMIDKNTQFAPGKFSSNKADLWKRLEGIFSPQEMQGFREGVTKEVGMQRTENFINPRAGSHTTPLREDIAELNAVPDAVAEMGINAVQGNVGGMVRTLLQSGRKLVGPSSKTAEGLARALLEMDPGEQRAILGRLSQSPRVGNIPRAKVEQLIKALTVGGAS